MKRILLLSLTLSATALMAHAQDEDRSVVSAKFSEPTLSKITLSKKAVVRIYPNPSYGKLSVSANTDNPVHFYIFDLEGTLVYQAVLTTRERKDIDLLKKGTYTYDVFEKDESIEEGKIIVK